MTEFFQVAERPRPEADPGAQDAAAGGVRPGTKKGAPQGTP